MNHILISWIALQNDFDNEKVNKNGPTFNFHRFYFKHDKHIIFSVSQTEQKVDFLISSLKLDFPEHAVEKRVVNIENIGDLMEVKTVMEKEILNITANHIDIFFSPGSSIMQLTWYILHTTLNLHTRLLQLMRQRYSRSRDKPDLVMVDAERSVIPVSAVLRQKKLDTVNATDDFLLTNSIKPVYESAYQIAQTDDITVLINGETGTGKEHLANFIHCNSSRHDKAFESINCSGLTDQLLESRLFGYKKGAFTGAIKSEQGIFRRAQGGTVFLDEIGDITPYMQQTLLRVLQNKEIQPLGEKSQKVNVRIIAASNKNLYELCKAGKFRFDLFYRIAIVDLYLPSLIERGLNEKKQYLKHFLEIKKKQFKRQNLLELDKKLRSFLLEYTFPGNIRELENLIERFYVFNHDKAGIDDLPPHMKDALQTTSLKLKDIEMQHIRKVLRICNYNKQQTARQLGIALNTLKNKLKKE